jgi:hypothetical protein
VYVAEGGISVPAFTKRKPVERGLYGEKTQRLSSLVGVLRSGNSGAIDESVTL